MRWIFSGCLAAALLGWAAGCATNPSPPKQVVAADPTILRVGVTPNAPPMVFKEGGRIVGVEADFAEALGRDLGRRVVFVEEPWDGLIDALCDNQNDIIMSSMSITLTRSYRIGFSDPYLKVGQMILARAGDKYNFLMNLSDQTKRGIGVKPGTTSDFLLRQELPKAKRKYYTTGEEAAEALLHNNVDLFVSDAPMIWYLAGKYESKGLVVVPLVLSQEQLGWGMRRTDTDLQTRVNRFLKAAQSSGELNQIMNRWVPGFR